MAGSEIAQADVATPCTKVCVVDAVSGLCLGCYRSLAEIGGWLMLDADARAAIMRDLLTRREALRALRRERQA